MNGEVVAALGLDGERGVDGILEAGDGGFFVIILVAIWLVSGDFPGGAVLVDVKFGQFVFDGDLTEFGLGWDFVAKSHGVIKNAKT